MPFEAEDTAVETEQTGTETQDAPEREFDREAAEAKVSERLAALRGDEGPEATDETETVQDEPQGQETGKEEPTETEEEEEAAEKGTPEKKAGESVAPTLPKGFPAAYARSLKAYDWTDEEIAEAAKNPSFLTTAAKIHQNRNKEVADWAAAGRQAREQQQSDQGQPQTLQALKAIDPAPLKEQYGDDKLIDALVSPVNAAIQQINQIVPLIQSAQESTRQSQLETLDREITGFFGGDELKSFSGFYGENGKTFSEDQTASRNKVLELANDLIAGATVRGKRLSLGQALVQAHDSVSSEYKTLAVRTELRGKLTAREKGISLRPTGKKGGGQNGAGKPASRDALAKKTESRLRSVFG